MLNNSHGTSDSDSDGAGYDQNSYEKLVNILQLANIMLMKAQNVSAAFLDFIYQQQKPMIVEAIVYLIEMKANKFI